MRKWILAVAVLSIAIAAWFGWHLWKTRFDVPVAFRGVQNTSIDAAPVDVVLHEYVRGDATTTGRSITFRFPKSHYMWAENAQGGPQYRIELNVEPILVLEDAIRKQATTSPDDQKLKIGQVRSNDLSILVYSPTKSISAVGGAAYTYKAFERGEAHPLGRMCDWTIFPLKRGALRPADDLAAGMTPEMAVQDAGFDLLGLSDQPSAVGALTAASCVGRSPICVVQVPYRDWMMSFHVKRRELCTWRAVAAKTADFLDAHVVAETERRAQ
jgi:hypothetical protein